MSNTSAPLTHLARQGGHAGTCSPRCTRCGRGAPATGQPAEPGNRATDPSAAEAATAHLAPALAHLARIEAAAAPALATARRRHARRAALGWGRAAHTADPAGHRWAQLPALQALTRALAPARTTRAADLAAEDSPTTPTDRDGYPGHQPEAAPTHPRAVAHTLTAAPGAPCGRAAAAA